MRRLFLLTTYFPSRPRHRVLNLFFVSSEELFFAGIYHYLLQQSVEWSKMVIYTVFATRLTFTFVG